MPIWFVVIVIVVVLISLVLPPAIFLIIFFNIKRNREMRRLKREVEELKAKEQK